MIIEGQTLINIDSYHYSYTYKKLCPSEEGKKKKQVVFPTMADLFVFSAILGFVEDCPRKIEKRYKQPPIRWQAIKQPHQSRLIALAVEKEGDLQVLKNANKLKQILEIHSNGGLYKIHEQIEMQSVLFIDIEGIINQVIGRLPKKKKSNSKY